MCAAAPAEESGGPPSGDTPSARAGAEVATGETVRPARAEKPSAEAPPAAPADAPLGPPPEDTASTGSGAGVTTGETGMPALAGPTDRRSPAVRLLYFTYGPIFSMC